MKISSNLYTPHNTINVYNNIPTYHFNSIKNRYNGNPILTEEYLTKCNSEINTNLPDEEKKKLFSQNLTRKAENWFKSISRR
jgi:hypothetical protein